MSAAVIKDGGKDGGKDGDSLEEKEKENMRLRGGCLVCDQFMDEAECVCCKLCFHLLFCFLVQRSF